MYFAFQGFPHPDPLPKGEGTRVATGCRQDACITKSIPGLKPWDAIPRPLERGAGREAGFSFASDRGIRFCAFWSVSFFPQLD